MTSPRRRTHETELSRAALIDPLTGLVNRRAFEVALASVAVVEAGGCIAVFDLDRFKAVNDAHGHVGGDEVLCEFARRAADQVRDGNVLARIGEKQFAVLFRSVDVPAAEAISELIRGAVSAAPVRIGEWPVAATVIVGVAQLRRSERPAGCFEHADRALHAAKREGRNRLRLAPEDPAGRRRFAPGRRAMRRADAAGLVI